MDGTLVDTNYHHAIAWSRPFRRHDVVLPVWRIHRAMGMDGDQLIKALAGQKVEEDCGDGIRAAENERYGELIGDSIYDCIAAGRAGLPSLTVLTGGFSREELKEAGASAVFESLAELRKKLRRECAGSGSAEARAQ